MCVVQTLEETEYNQHKYPVTPTVASISILAITTQRIVNCEQKNVSYTFPQLYAL